MGNVKRFEDLIAWQKARLLTRTMYQVTRHSEFAPNTGLRDRLRMSAVSVMTNIAGGFERGSRADFLEYLDTAKSGCDEVSRLLYSALDGRYVSEQEYKYLRHQADQVLRALLRLEAAVKRQS